MVDLKVQNSLWVSTIMIFLQVPSGTWIITKSGSSPLEPTGEEKAGAEGMGIRAKRGAGKPEQWSPDGSQVLFNNGPYIYAAAADGSRVQSIVDTSAELPFEVYVFEGVGIMTHFDVSPDGFRLVYSACRYPTPPEVEYPASECLQESRGSRNVQHRLVGLLRQSVYSRLAGYEDTNDAERLAQDPTMRVIVGRRGGPERPAASTNTMSRFETEVLTQDGNVEGLGRVNARWVDREPARLDAGDHVNALFDAMVCHPEL